MEIYAFTDFHGNSQAYRKARNLIAEKKPDLVLVGGDLYNYDLEAAKRYLNQLAETSGKIYFVPGNMDSPQLKDWPGNEKVISLHGGCRYHNELALIGLGGSPHGPFQTLFEYDEADAAKILEKALAAYCGGTLILVSHCPPKETRIDKTYSGIHAGSISVRNFIERSKPILVISGHIHESQGIDFIGPTTVINTGPAQGGNYARITVDHKVEVKFEQF